MTTTKNKKKKPAPRMTAAQLADLIELAAGTATPDDLERFRQLAARIGDRYSLTNRLAIWAQAPHATEVHGIHEWRRHGRRVARGQRGIGIFAPIIERRTDNQEQQEQQEQQDDTVSRVRRYRVAYVWDITQTRPLDCTCPPTSSCTCPLPAPPPPGPLPNLDDVHALVDAYTNEEESK